MENKIKKITVEICRILIGFVFIFSGFVKAVDPMGSAYKFHDYFEAFKMNFLDVLSLPAAFGLSAIEFALGLCILLGVYKRLTSLFVLLFMFFMTSLTLYLAINDPVSDCGCFGDALILSNWNTFYKNIVLLLASICVFVWNKQITPLFSSKSHWLIALYAYIFIFSVSGYCYKNLPIFDFRPYKVGASIPDLMKIPDGMPQDEYGDPILVYEKDGEKKEFTLEDYPEGDSTWVFVESKTKLIKKGYTPPIHDFTITDIDKVEITDQILADTSYTFLLIAHNLKLQMIIM